MLTQLSEDLFCLPVPKDAVKIELTRQIKYYYLNFIFPDGGTRVEEGFALFYKDFNGRSKYPDSLTVLGTVSLKGISFDPELFVECNGLWQYKDYKKYNKYFDDPKPSFLSLLHARGFYWQGGNLMKEYKGPTPIGSNIGPFALADKQLLILKKS